MQKYQKYMEMQLEKHQQEVLELAHGTPTALITQPWAVRSSIVGAIGTIIPMPVCWPSIATVALAATTVGSARSWWWCSTLISLL